MKRRDFITPLGRGRRAAWPLMARAQHMPDVTHRDHLDFCANRQLGAP